MMMSALKGAIIDLIRDAYHRDQRTEFSPQQFTGVGVDLPAVIEVLDGLVREGPKLFTDHLTVRRGELVLWEGTGAAFRERGREGFEPTDTIDLVYTLTPTIRGWLDRVPAPPPTPLSDALRNPEHLQRLRGSWDQGHQRFAHALFKVMFDLGLCGQDYDDQIHGAEAAGLITAKATDIEDALRGAYAFRDPTGGRAVESQWEEAVEVAVAAGLPQPPLPNHDSTRDDFKAWLVEHRNMQSFP